jgi:hypothetical protein
MRRGSLPISANAAPISINCAGKSQGIQFQSKGDAVHYVGNPEGVYQSTRRQVVEEVNRLNGLLADEKLDPEIQTRIAQYEMAFRMQTSVPELTDFASEPPPRAMWIKQARRWLKTSSSAACSRTRW